MNDTPALEKLSARIRSILPRYIAKQTSEVSRIESLLRSQDFGEIVRIGHAISGTGMGYGLPELGKLGAAMEEAAEAQDLAEVSHCERALHVMLKGLQEVQ